MSAVRSGPAPWTAASAEHASRRPGCAPASVGPRATAGDVAGGGATRSEAATHAGGDERRVRRDPRCRSNDTRSSSRIQIPHPLHAEPVTPAAELEEATRLSAMDERVGADGVHHLRVESGGVRLSQNTSAYDWAVADDERDRPRSCEYGMPAQAGYARATSASWYVIRTRSAGGRPSVARAYGTVKYGRSPLVVPRRFWSRRTRWKT